MPRPLTRKAADSRGCFIPALSGGSADDPDTRRTEVFRRNAEGLFVLYDMSEAAALELASIDCRIDIGDVFDGLDISPASPADPAA